MIYSLATRCARLHYSDRYAREQLHKYDHIRNILDEILFIENKHSNTHRSKQYQLRKVCQGIDKLFEYITNKLNTCVIKYFVKRALKTKNMFWEVSKPLWNSEFAAIFNAALKEKKHNKQRQLYICISRIAAQISFRQNNRINNMVCCLVLHNCFTKIVELF